VTEGSVRLAAASPHWDWVAAGSPDQPPDNATGNDRPDARPAFEAEAVAEGAPVARAGGQLWGSLGER